MKYDILHIVHTKFVCLSLNILTLILSIIFLVFIEKVQHI